MKSKHIKVLFNFIIIYLIVILIWTSFIYFILIIESEKHLEALKQKELNDINLQYSAISLKLEDVISDIKIISTQNELFDFLKNPSKKNKIRLANEFQDFANSRKNYDQIRYLDKSGMELVRVNFVNGKAVIVPDDKLQNKKHRYYFKDSLALDKGEVFISKLDLNMENKKIEIPYKPMIRLGYPIFDENNNKRGVVITNYLAQRIINLIKNNNSELSHGYFLLNKDKYFLISDIPEEEWAFMFPDKKNLTFDRRFPGIWSKISVKECDQFYNKKGLFTYRHINPHLLFYGKKHNCENNIKSDFDWIILSFIDAKIIDTPNTLFKKRFAFTKFIYFIAFFPALLFTYLINNRNKLKQKLIHNANYDILTDLPNRMLFNDRIKQTLEISKRYGQKFAVLFLDLDDFKKVNDMYGHKAGDEVLIEVSKRISGFIRSSDTFARIGGDEFTVILNNIANKDGVIKVANKIIELVSHPIKLSNEAEVKIGISIGIALFPDDGDYEDRIVSKADNAMYKAKLRGKNNFAFAEGD